MRKVALFLWRRKKWVLLALVVLGGVWWWRGRQNPTEVMVTVTPDNQDISQELAISGAIEAHSKARLTFPAASRLTWIGIKEGDQVKAWQAIAKVDTQALEKQLQIDLNTHGKIFRAYEGTAASVDYYSSSGLNESERRTFETAQLDLRSAVLGVEIRDIAIKLSSLVTPIAGIVTRVDQPNAGATILPTDVFEVVDPKSIYFSVTVDEEDIGQVKVGLPAHINLDAFSGLEVTSQVAAVGFAARATEGGGTGYKVELGLALDNENLAYKLGMNGEAHIILAQKTGVMTIPLDALISKDDGTYVEIKAGNEVKEQKVETGIESEERVEISSGLTYADQVVVPKNGD